MKLRCSRNVQDNVGTLHPVAEERMALVAEERILESKARIASNLL